MLVCCSTKSCMLSSSLLLSSPPFSSIDHHFRLHVCKCSSNEHQSILYVVLWCCIVMLGPTTSAKRPDVVCITFEIPVSQFVTHYIVTSFNRGFHGSELRS